MELWIRSQDKMKLVEVNYVYVIESNDHFTMYGETIDSAPIIGIYKTKERALEVLDEIHRLLINLQCLEVAPDVYKIIKGNLNCVYEMPKE